MSIGVHVVALSLDFTMSKFLCAIFIQVSNVICTAVDVVVVCLFCLCMHSLYHPWPSTEKGSGGLPRVHRLLCGLPRVHRGLRTLLPGTPQCSDQAVTTAAS